MSYSFPRPVYERLAETLRDRKAAETFAVSLENAVTAMELEIRRDSLEKNALLKVELKDELSRILVTREFFEERFQELEFRFQGLEVRVQGLEIRVQGVEERLQGVEERLQRVEGRLQGLEIRLLGVEERLQGIEIRLLGVEGRFAGIDERFESMNLRFQMLEEKMEQRFLVVEERFKRLELWLKFLVGLSVLGLTMANPGFTELIKGLLK